MITIMCMKYHCKSFVKHISILDSYNNCVANPWINSHCVYIIYSILQNIDYIASIYKYCE